MEEPTPAPRSTSTSCPARTNSTTPAGVSATRYSRFLTSRGTPTRMTMLLLQGGGSQLPMGEGAAHRDVGGPVGACLVAESRHDRVRFPRGGPGHFPLGVVSSREDVDAPVRPTPRPAPAPGARRCRRGRLDRA